MQETATALHGSPTVDLPNMTVTERLTMFLDDDHEAVEAAELTKQTLVDTQARMGVMLDFMPMGLLTTQGRELFSGTKKLARLLQVPQNEVVGKHFLDFLTTHFAEAAQQMEDAFDGLIGEIANEVGSKTIGWPSAA